MKTFYLLFFLCAILIFTLSCNRQESLKSSAKLKAEYYLDQAESSSLSDSIRLLYLDSAYTDLADKPNDTLTRFLYRRATVNYYNANLYERSMATARKVYALAADAKDSLSMGKAMMYLGEAHFGNMNNDSAFYYYNEAEEIYNHLTDKRTLGEVILYKAYVYHNIGEYVLCESEAWKAMKYLMHEKRPTDIYNCYNLIAAALDGQNSNEDAIYYYQQAYQQLDDYKQEGYSDEQIALNRVSCFNNMGGVYVKMGKHQEAINIYQKALSYKEAKTSQLLYAKLLNNMAYAKFKAGDKKGLPGMFYQSLQIRNSLDNEPGIIASYLILGEYYMQSSDKSRAITYLKKANAQAEKIKSNFEVLKSLKLLWEVDKDNGMSYYSRYVTISDSLQEIAEATRNKYARIEYETAQLENEKEELIKRNSFIIGVSAVILLFLAAIFIIYYLNSRNKKLLLIQEQQKANEEIYQLMYEQQSKIEKVREEEKSRIAMELHDGILNNIYAVRLNLEFINKKSDDESIAKRKEYIKALQEVETEIRGVSHDLSRNVIFKDKSFRDLLESLIVTQINNFNTVFEAVIDPTIDWDSMPNTQKVNIYRIVQEGLQNINKYSQASHARVEINHEDNSIVIVISDNGVGFDPDKTKGGIGIKNLRKRTAALNGHVRILSGVGNGSKIEVVFPD